MLLRAALSATALVTALSPALPAQAHAAPSPAASVVSVKPYRLAAVVSAAKAGVASRAMYLYGGGHGSKPNGVTGRNDCSGFVRAAYWAGFGMDIGGGGSESIRSGGKFRRVGVPVPGDVAVFGSGSASHVAIYVSGSVSAPLLAEQSETGTPARLKVRSNMSRFLGWYRFSGVTAQDMGSAPVVRPADTKVLLPKKAVRPGERSNLSGVVRAGGKGAAGVPVKLYQRVLSGHWSFAGVKRTNSAGRVVFPLTGNGKAHYYQLRSGATAKVRSDVSSSVKQLTRFWLGRPAGFSSSAGAVVGVAGNLDRRAAGVKVWLQRWVAGRGWVSQRSAVVNSVGYYLLPYRMPSGGLQRFRVVLPAKGSVASSVSAVRVVAVR